MIALIFGISGQAGSYLSELLLEKGHIVHGVKRRSSSINTSRIDHLYERIKLHYGDITDTLSVLSVIKEVRPDYIFNLAAQSHVRVSFDIPHYTCEATAMGVVNIMEAVRILGLAETRVLQCSSSEMFGKVQEIPQKETTPFYPRSPYGIAKQFGYWYMKNCREAYNMFAANIIMFNCESPRRGETFVTKKITTAAARIALGLQDCLYLGNLDAKRDWGHAIDYTAAMLKIIEHDTADDFVVATGETTSVREFAAMAFAHLGNPVEFIGKGEDEIGVSLLNGNEVIKIDPRYYRPTEVDLLIGDASKSKQVLGWSPTFTIKDIVKEMVEYDFKLAKKEIHGNN